MASLKWRGLESIAKSYAKSAICATSASLRCIIRANTSSQLNVRTGLPAPSCSRCLRPGWSHHTLQSRKPQRNLGTDHLIPVTNPIESVFATVRHRTVRTKGALSAKTAKLMVFKLVDAAAKTWRRLKGQH